MFIIPPQWFMEVLIFHYSRHMIMKMKCNYISIQFNSIWFDFFLFHNTLKRIIWNFGHWNTNLCISGDDANWRMDKIALIKHAKTQKVAGSIPKLLGFETVKNKPKIKISDKKFKTWPNKVMACPRLRALIMSGAKILAIPIFLLCLKIWWKITM